MSKHTTGWEDGRMTEVYCDGHWTGGVISADEGDEPFVCDRCGAVLRLVWDVRIEEVPRPGPGEIQEPSNALKRKGA